MELVDKAEGSTTLNVLVDWAKDGIVANEITRIIKIEYNKQRIKLFESSRIFLSSLSSDMIPLYTKVNI